MQQTWLCYVFAVGLAPPKADLLDQNTISASGAYRRARWRFGEVGWRCWGKQTCRRDDEEKVERRFWAVDS